MILFSIRHRVDSTSAADLCVHPLVALAIGLVPNTLFVPSVPPCTGGTPALEGLGSRNRVGIGLSYRPARLQRLAEQISWNRFLGSLKVKKIPSLRRGCMPSRPSKVTGELCLSFRFSERESTEINGDIASIGKMKTHF